MAKTANRELSTPAPLQVLAARRSLRDPVALPGEPFTTAAAIYNGAKPAMSVIPQPGGGVRAAVAILSPAACANHLEEDLARMKVELKLPYPDIWVRGLPGARFSAAFHFAARLAARELELTSFYDDPANRIPALGAYQEPYDNMTYWLRWGPHCALLGLYASHVGPNIQLKHILGSEIVGYGPTVPHGSDVDSMLRVVRGTTRSAGLVRDPARVITNRDGKIERVEFDKKPQEDERPSTQGLGGIPLPPKLTHICSVATVVQKTIFSIGEIDKMHFPDPTGKLSPDEQAGRDLAARRVVRSLGLIMFSSMASMDTTSLRAGCCLVPDEIGEVVAFGPTGPLGGYKLPPLPTLAAEYIEAVGDAEKRGFSFESTVVEANEMLRQLFDKAGPHMNRKADTASPAA